MAPTYDIILVLHSFRNNLRDHESLCRSLRDLDAHYLIGADGFHRAATDTGLVVLRFSPQAAERLGGRFLQLFARRSGLPIVVPSELDPTTRRNFFLHQLSRYTTYVQQYCTRGDGPGVAERVVRILGEHLRTQDAAPAAATFAPQPSLPAARGA